MRRKDFIPQSILIVVAQFLEQRSCGLRRRRLIMHDSIHPQVIVHNISNSLCIGRGTRAAAPDGVVDLCQFVCYTVCDVGAGGGTGVGAENDALVECDSHAGLDSVSRV